MAIVIIAFIISMLGLASGSVFYKMGAERQADPKSSPALLCFFYFLIAAIGYVVAGFITNISFTATLPTLITALIGGVCFSAAAYLYILSLKSGPFTISAVLLNFSNFAPILYCLIFPGDMIGLVTLSGIILMAISVYVLTSRNKGEGETGVNKKWILYITLTFITNSIISYCIRLQEHFAVKNESVIFYVILFGSAAIISLIIFLAMGGAKIKQNSVRLLPPAIGLALTISANVFPQTILYQHSVPAAVQSPIINGGAILLAALFGRIFFKDKLSLKAWIAIIIGIVAIVLLGI
ncbi:MAG: hypothetical protein IJP16_01150 [Clostridia bacterium]|nr:hypothetical protein [Clostridia bacterium]